MNDTTTDSWTGWQQQINKHLGEHGLLPTPTTEGLDYPVRCGERVLDGRRHQP